MRIAMTRAQIQQVKSLLTKEISALVIIPHDGAAMAEGCASRARERHSGAGV
jgi:ABC-type xylose transport system substrate-binding protein